MRHRVRFAFCKLCASNFCISHGGLNDVKQHVNGPARNRRLVASEQPSVYAKGSGGCTIHSYRVHIQNVEALSSPLDPKPLPSDPLLSRDKSLVLAWDVETYDLLGGGEVPDPKNLSAWIFMIGVTLHWKDETESLARICLVDKTIAIDQAWQMIICPSEQALILGFAQILHHYARVHLGVQWWSLWLALSVRVGPA